MAHFSAERDILKHEIRNRLNLLQATFYRLRRPIEGWETVAVGRKQDVAPPPTDGWHPYRPGTPWGGPDTTQWFRARVTLPPEMTGKPVVAILHPAAEALCYLDGVPVQGLDENRSVVRLAENAETGTAFDLLIDAWARHGPAVFDVADVAVADDLAWSFYWDLKVAFDVAVQQPTDSHLYVRLLDLVDEASRRVDFEASGDAAAYRAAIRAAQDDFRRKLRDYQHSQSAGAHTFTGQSHLDTAWLWPLRVTRKKCARTFSTALKYMEQYPEYTFIMSQAQLYEYVKDHYPTIWEGVKRRVAEGRWEVNGAAWVEQDLNIPSGEAHVRQYLYGNRFFRKEFGIHTRMVWLPDCFGYTFSLPQIMRKAGIEGFATTKLHGNEYNRHPYHLFRWRGLDGSEVVAIQFPIGCNADPRPEGLKFSWDNFLQKDIADELPFTYGHGDGGGGPTAEQIEMAKRLQNMSGMPAGRFGTVQECVDRIMARIDRDRMPVFHDEMYYEKHRGCQTSQARTKRNNRKSELLARDAELLASLATLKPAQAAMRYPQDEIYGAWKLILLNQFHDILPGSSIAEVYEEAERDYAAAQTTLRAVCAEALAALDARIDTRGEGTPVIVRNTLGWDRDDVALLPLDGIAADGLMVQDGDGKPTASQVVTCADGKSALLFEAHVPSVGHAVYRLVSGAPRAPSAAAARLSGNRPPRATATRLENDFFLVQLARDGSIRRLYDKRAQRDVVPKGSQGNDLQLLEDRPPGSDAWDIAFDIDETRFPIDGPVAITVTETGPVRATVRVIRRTAKSTITQDISLWRSIPRIDFATSVEWGEKHKLLKAAFPVDVLSRTATYEIQYGAIERPTHYSTSYDRARFEVPGHRWIDLSEADYGVSLLNDCKYGFNVHDNVMRISLLRSPTSPDPHCDEGHHEFVYSLYPHAGSWREAATVRRAYELNVPLVANLVTAHAGDTPARGGFASADRANVVIDCIKKAEDSDALIVRVYEAHGARGPVRLTLASPPRRVAECDLMEENDMPVERDGACVSFDIKPWEIRTFKVEM